MKYVTCLATATLVVSGLLALSAPSVASARSATAGHFAAADQIVTSGQFSTAAELADSTPLEAASQEGPTAPLATDASAQEAPNAPMVAEDFAQATPSAPMVTAEVSAIFCRAGERTLNARSKGGRTQCQLALRESRGCFTGDRRQVAELINQGKFDWGETWLESAHLWDLDSITYLFVDGANHHKIPSSMERCSSAIFR